MRGSSTANLQRLFQRNKPILPIFCDAAKVALEQWPAPTLRQGPPFSYGSFISL
jgi:hypothetical protein